jgi:hypothetical protein
MYHLDCNDEWNHIHSKDLWIYNKLFLSRVLGYTCGPIGSKVPKPDFYIVRPSFNLLGMGRFARKEWIECDTNHYHPAEFWCEIFKGEHLSVDFHHQKSELVVLGTRNSSDPYYKWQRWEKIDRKIDFPEILKDLNGNYDWINCEFIGEKLIEVQFRRNPDFRYNNSVAIPIWDDNYSEDLNFIRDDEYDTYGRRGLFVK